MDDEDDNDNNNDTMTMNTTEIINAVDRMTKLTRQALVFNQALAEKYNEKLQHLTSTYHMVKNFERQLLFDLEVD
jgi:hypothetical protein